MTNYFIKIEISSIGYMFAFDLNGKLKCLKPKTGVLVDLKIIQPNSHIFATTICVLQ